jgi:hypothetical protein
MNGKLFAWLILLALPLVAGCSSFNRRWRDALEMPIPQSDISGPWEGRWISEVNGHNDRLRCVITPGVSNELDAHFHANYRRIFHFGYTVPLAVRNTGTNFTFSGEADLGKLAGGAYSYEGYATPTNFFSTYNSKYDHGRFEMSRPIAR